MGKGKAAASSGGGHTMVWFRKGLRLHDNPALLAACEGSQAVFPVFCLDPWFLKPQVVGVNRLSFLLQSLADLHAGLEARGSRLLVVRGKPLERLPQLWRDWGITRLHFEVDTEAYAKERDAEIARLAQEQGVEVQTFVSNTLYETSAIVKANSGKCPVSYKAFEAAATRVGEPPPPVGDLPSQIPPVAPKARGAAAKETGVPSLKELGYDMEPTTSFRGGETEALAILARALADKAWVAAFEKPKTDPAAFRQPATTTLSPYLKFGCLSARLFYARLQQILAERKTHSKPPVSLVGQLLWREFFYTCNAHVPHFDRMEGNPICKQIPWDDNPGFYEAWDQGRTGYPWIDAIMAQLHREGWMHHLARHSVACFLTRGDLYVSWERGRDTFDRLLVDADPSINNGNWLWLSASAFFFQYFRVYSPITFGKKYDKEGAFIREFLPVLRKMPAQYIYEPWKAPKKVQQEAGCIIGKDYPEPIVEHATVHKANIQRHKEAYDAEKAASPSGGKKAASTTPKGTPAKKARK